MEFTFLTIGAALFLIGYIWTGIIAFRTDREYGKWAFLSGMYRINFCKAHWNETKIPFSATILGMVLILIGVII